MEHGEEVKNLYKAWFSITKSLESAGRKLTNEKSHFRLRTEVPSFQATLAKISCDYGWMQHGKLCICHLF